MKLELQQIPPPGTPFEVIGIDHVGPFPKTASGSKYIIVATDYLTKWVEVAAVPDTGATHLVTFLNNLVLRHGSPRMIISDRGTPFMSRLFEGALQDYGIEHAAASPYHPQTNGLVERTNRTLGDILSAYVNTSHKNWDEYVNTAAFALNTSRQETTCQTPFELVYGRLATLPHESAMDTTWTHRGQDYANGFARRLREARERARLAILHKQSTLAERFSTDAVTPSFQPGDLVLVRRHLRRQHLSEKLLPRYCGPFRIKKQLGPVTYRLEELPVLSRRKRKRVFPTHASQLKLYITRKDYLGAVRDEQISGVGRV